MFYVDHMLNKPTYYVFQYKNGRKLIYQTFITRKTMFKQIWIINVVHNEVNLKSPFKATF